MIQQYFHAYKPQFITKPWFSSSAGYTHL